MKRAFILIFVVLLGSFAPMHHAQNASEPTRNLNLVDQPELPARGGRVDWGLALSGGGIRSGSYSIGVMKALFDAGIIDNVDAISTVSGGGFAAYWAFGKQLKAPEGRFGARSFAGSEYLSGSCSLMKRSQMYGKWKMFKSLFLSGGKASESWARSIHKTFGQNDPQLANITLDSLASSDEKKSLPYLIINTSLLSEETENLEPLCEYQALVELTPARIGSSLYGTSDWSIENPSPKTRKAISTSAAGKAKIKQSYRRFSSKVEGTRKDPNTVHLYDGGCSENLGALSLIKRRIENIVIVDAEHDPYYRFGSYVKLREASKALGIDLIVPDIEPQALPRSKVQKGCPESWFSKLKKSDRRKAPQRSVMIGTAINRQTNQKSTVYYLKMSRSSEIFPDDLEKKEWKGVDWQERDHLLTEYFAPLNDSFRLGSQVAAKFDHAVEIDRKGDQFKFSCDGANGLSLSESDLYNMYSYRVLRYGYYASAKRRFKTLGMIGDFFVYDFPQTSTADQALFPDQMEALIGLGYLQGRSLADKVGASAAAQ